MRIATILILGALLLPACLSEEAAAIEAACTHVCACRSPLPAAQETCETSCVEEAAAVLSPAVDIAACTDCLNQLTCFELSTTPEPCMLECSDAPTPDDDAP